MSSSIQTSTQSSRVKEKRKAKKSNTSLPSDWDIKVNFTKSMLNAGKRGVIVTVTQLSTGKKLQKSETASTKNEARAKAEKIIEQLKKSFN